MAEAMAAMLLLSFAVLLFSAMVIQSGRLMDRGSKSMDDYYRGQNALNARTENGAEGMVQIEEKFGENAFAGLTPALRRGEGNEISVSVYRQSLNGNTDSTAENSDDTAENTGRLFTYDLAEKKYVETEDKGE